MALENELKAVKKDGILRCPYCQSKLHHFSGYGKDPAGKYCVNCANRIVYSKDGEVIGKWE